MTDYKPVIGLEIHVELKTKSKMFCQCDANYFGKDPNSNTCPVCLGLPGALPVPNKKAVDWTILIGKALNCHINKISKFDRKHYFYPDLPKGYQISQYDEPIAISGQIMIKNNISKVEEKKKFRITRVHLEEDTGKLIHSGADTLVDFNRSGVPLVEIVTEPDFDNAEDVKRFLEELHTIIRYLDVSDADMEKGSMRMEPNISVMIKDERSRMKDKLPNYKVEVKNINSFRFVKQAIEYEIERQTEILKKGETPIQETRGFDAKRQMTYSQRTKEEAQDYRYFPEPDIPPMTFSKQFIDSIIIPELPQKKMDRYIATFNIKPADAFTLTREKEMSDFFEKVISGSKISAQTIANVLINRKQASDLTVKEFIKNISEKMAPVSVNEKEQEVLINRLIESNPKVVADYKKGKENAIMFLVGQAMREMKGKADAKLIMVKIKSKLR